MSSPPTPPSVSQAINRGTVIAPGLLVSFLIAVAATGLGGVIPLVGSAIPAVVIGVLIALLRRPNARLVPGITFSSKFILQFAVVLLGSQLTSHAVASRR